jgi:hypothetical protein
MVVSPPSASPCSLAGAGEVDRRVTQVIAGHLEDERLEHADGLAGLAELDRELRLQVPGPRILPGLAGEFADHAHALDEIAPAEGAADFFEDAVDGDGCHAGLLWRNWRLACQPGILNPGRESMSAGGVRCPD